MERALALLPLIAGLALPASALEGRIADAAGAPVAGAWVSSSRGDPSHSVTVFSEGAGPLGLRVRRIGFRDLGQSDVSADASLALVLERETDPSAVAAQLPANRWYALVLDRVADPVQREELVRQCTYCHQQGNAATRRVRDPEEWHRVLALMGRMGGMVSSDLRAQIPEL